MEIRAKARFVRISPQKIRLIMGQVRGKKVESLQESLRNKNSLKLKFPVLTR